MAIIELSNYAEIASAGAPDMSGTAGSLIAVLDYCLVTNAGWTKVFSGTNKAVYKQPAGSNGFYLRVDDSNAQNARVIGYETMTDVDNGNQPFPNGTQVAGGMYHYKSDVASSAARKWYFISNGKAFYFSSDVTANTSTTARNTLVFGDFTSNKSGDGFNTVIMAEETASKTTSLNNRSENTHTLANCRFFPRSHTQVGSSTRGSIITDTAKMAAAYEIGASGLPYPHAIDGGLYLAPIWLTEHNQGIRGVLNGVYAPLHPRSLNHLDTFAGNGDYTGKTFRYVHGGYAGAWVFDITSNGW